MSIVNDSTEKLSAKNEQIRSTKEQMNELIDKTLPVLSTTRTLANEINLEDFTEIKWANCFYFLLYSTVYEHINKMICYKIL